jgi:hypothetical protein
MEEFYEVAVRNEHMKDWRLAHGTYSITGRFSISFQNRTRAVPELKMSMLTVNFSALLMCISHSNSGSSMFDLKENVAGQIVEKKYTGDTPYSTHKFYNIG